MLPETVQWLKVIATTPDLAPGTMAAAELDLLSSQEPEDGAFSDEVVADLAASPWLRQDVHARGSYLSTLGLRERCDHPELVMLNVPSGAIDWASWVLNTIAGYLAESGAELRPGEIYLGAGMVAETAFTFKELDDAGAESIGFDGRDLSFLVVVPMPM